MEIILLFLTASVMGALFLVSYRIGYRDGCDHQKKQDENKAIHVNRSNQKVVKGYTDFADYNG